MKCKVKFEKLPASSIMLRTVSHKPFISNKMYDRHKNMYYFMSYSNYTIYIVPICIKKYKHVLR